MTARFPLAFLGATALAALALGGPAYSHGNEEHAAPAGAGTMLEQMREMHEGHEHGHDFEAMEEMSPEQMQRVMEAMSDLGLAVPPMSAHRGREIFVEKGCVVCHQVNGVGGEIGPSLDAAEMPSPMNAFEFAARMWRGADAMIDMQEQLFGEQITLSGQELADLVAFAHDEIEQKELSTADLPEKFRELIGN